MAALGKVFIVIGVIAFAGAVAWWYFYFEQFHGVDVKDASDCFYYFRDECLPTAVETLIGGSEIPPYSPYALWASASVAAIGILLLALAPFRK